MKWTVQLEPAEGISYDPINGTSSNQTGTRVKYRPAHQRGRYTTFVIYDVTPSELEVAPSYLESIIDRFNAESGPRAWRDL